MSKENLFVKVWESEAIPFMDAIEQNTRAYTKAVSQQDRDRINEAIRDADARLNDLYRQFGEAYDLIFPKKEESPPIEPVVPVTPSPSPAQVDTQNNSSARRGAPQAFFYPADPPAETLPSEEQHVLDVPNRYEENDSPGTPDDENGDDDEEEHIDSVADAPVKKKRTGLYVFLVLLCVAAIIGGIFILDRYLEEDPITPEDDLPPTISAVDLSYWFQELSVEQPINYNTNVRNDYESYDEWTKDIGIAGVFNDTEHQSIEENFYNVYIKDQSLETVAENTAKLFWAMDLYFDIYLNYDNYDFMRDNPNNTVVTLYNNVGYSDRVGDIFASIVGEFDLFRTTINEQEDFVVERLWSLVF